MDTTLIRENKTCLLLFYVPSLVVHLWLILYYDLGIIWFTEFVALSVLGAVIVRLIVKTPEWIYIAVIFVGVTFLEEVILYYQHEVSCTIPVICIVINNGTGICLLCLQRDQPYRVGLSCPGTGVAPGYGELEPRRMQFSTNKQVIGIFSRAVEEEYAWLTDILQSRFSVFSFYVGSSNYQNFISEVSRCNFAILYHSKTRGRVNITDVTDSLYDRELEHLSVTLGKRRVVVVADDLDDSSWETKRRILENQPSISLLGQELFLFTKHDKQSPNLRSNVEPLVKLFHSA